MTPAALILASMSLGSMDATAASDGAAPLAAALAAGALVGALVAAALVGAADDPALEHAENTSAAGDFARPAAFTVLHRDGDRDGSWLFDNFFLALASARQHNAGRQQQGK